MNGNPIRNRYFGFALIVHTAYFLVVLILYVAPHAMQFTIDEMVLDVKSAMFCDFEGFYWSGRHFSSILSSSELYDSAYRGLPFGAVLWIWCSVMSYGEAAVANLAATYATNVATCAILFKMVEDKQNGMRFIPLLLTTPIQLGLMAYGNDSSYVCLCLALGYFLFGRRKFISGILFGVAVLYKPIVICVLPLMVSFREGKLDFGGSAKRMCGAAAPLAPNAMLCVVNPDVISTFVSMNFEGASPMTNSVSVFIGFVTGVSYGVVFVLLFASTNAVLLFLYYFKRDSELAEYWKLSLLIAVTVFTISWDHYYLYYAVFAIACFSRRSTKAQRVIFKVCLFETILKAMLYTITYTTDPLAVYLINSIGAVLYVFNLAIEVRQLLMDRKISIPKN